MDEVGNPLTVLHEIVNERWEVCLTMSEKGFQQVSFVNSIATTKVMFSFTSMPVIENVVCIVSSGPKFCLGLLGWFTVQVSLAPKTMFGCSSSLFVLRKEKKVTLFLIFGFSLGLSSKPQGGRHVDYVADQVITKLIEVVKKKNKAGVAVKPFQVFLHH